MSRRTGFISLVVVIALILVSWQTFNKRKTHSEKVHIEKENFNPIGKLPGVKTNYNLSLKMQKDETFDVQAVIDIQNTSNDTMNSVELYFIPNMFTKENSPSLKHPSNLHVQNISVNNIPSTYNLFKDKLTIPLKTKLETNQTISLAISYSFSLPEEGFRFTKKGENFYLAQWYPMVPTYIEGKGWNKNNYQFKGESYHTTFSDFTLSYDIPKEYTVVTSSDAEDIRGHTENQHSIQNVKEVFIGILKKTTVVSKKVGDTEIRLFNFDESDQQVVMDTACKSLEFFQSTVGPYPFKQLDIIASDAGMEYPGVVTVHVKNNWKSNWMVVHEIAHQWFYGVISNDPYSDAWLDEGMTTLVTSLFLAEKEELQNDTLQIKLEPKPLNLPINEYKQEEYSNYIYGQSSRELLKIFREYGGRETLVRFLKEYYTNYQYKELDTKEFIRFLKYELGIKDDQLFEGWLKLK